MGKRKITHLLLVLSLFLSNIQMGGLPVAANETSSLVEVVSEIPQDEDLTTPLTPENSELPVGSESSADAEVSANEATTEVQDGEPLEGLDAALNEETPVDPASNARVANLADPSQVTIEQTAKSITVGGKPYEPGMKVLPSTPIIFSESYNITSPVVAGDYLPIRISSNIVITQTETKKLYDEHKNEIGTITVTKGQQEAIVTFNEYFQNNPENPKISISYRGYVNRDLFDGTGSTVKIDPTGPNVTLVTPELPEGEKLYKGGERDSKNEVEGYAVFRWEVRINAHSENLTNVVFTDTLQGPQKFGIPINNNGTIDFQKNLSTFTLIPGGLGAESERTAVNLSDKVSYKAEDKQMTINLGNIDQPYFLVYRTYMPLTNADGSENTVAINGANLSSDGTTIFDLERLVNVSAVDGTGSGQRFESFEFAFSKQLFDSSGSPEVLEPETFNFILKGGIDGQADTHIELKSTNDADGNVKFDKIKFDRVGQYVYKVSEVLGVDKTINYDNSIYVITVDVTQEQNVFKGLATITKNGQTVDQDNLLFVNKRVPTTTEEETTEPPVPSTTAEETTESPVPTTTEVPSIEETTQTHTTETTTNDLVTTIVNTTVETPPTKKQLPRTGEQGLFVLGLTAITSLASGLWLLRKNSKSL
ncbi:TPA: FctA domain-containing protein [Streptococcus suis]